MEDTYLDQSQYFSHDSDASQDPKIVAMRSIYGWLGYGWYWMLVEMMRGQQDYRLSIEGKYAFNAFAMLMQCTEEQAQQFITDCINEFRLFKSDGIYFWSESLLRRMQKAEEKSKKARDAALARWNKGAMQTHSDSNAIKEKESKEKESKEDYSLAIKELRSRYSLEQLNLIDRYLEILRTTRRSGTISTSVTHGVYEDMHRYDPIIVEYACKTVINKPDLHGKKENYFAGILRNTTMEEAVKGTSERASPTHEAPKPKPRMTNDTVSPAAIMGGGSKLFSPGH